MSIEDLTESNWKDYAKEIAEERFPINSLVTFHYPLQASFGKVKKITSSGRIHVTPGNLCAVKRELSGAYWEIDYSPNTFTPGSGFFQDVLRFMPHYYKENNKIEWQGSRDTVQYSVLEPLEPNENGLFHDTVLNY